MLNDELVFVTPCRAGWCIFRNYFRPSLFSQDFGVRTSLIIK